MIPRIPIGPMGIPGEIYNLLEIGKRKVLVLQWVGTGALGLFGPGLLLFLLLSPPPADFNRTPGLAIAAGISLLFAAGLMETLRLSSTYRQVDRLLQEDPTRIARVELDLKPFRTVVLPKVRIYVDAKRNARYVMDMDSAHRVLTYFEKQKLKQG